MFLAREKHKITCEMRFFPKDWCSWYWCRIRDENAFYTLRPESHVQLGDSGMSLFSLYQASRRVFFSSPDVKLLVTGGFCACVHHRGGSYHNDKLLDKNLCHSWTSGCREFRRVRFKSGCTFGRRASDYFLLFIFFLFSCNYLERILNIFGSFSWIRLGKASTEWRIHSFGLEDLLQDICKYMRIYE